MGRLVQNVAPMAQFLDAAMIGRSGTDLGYLHHLGPIDVKFRPKVTAVPKVEQAHVKTDMRGIQAAVLGKLSKDPVQVSYIIDLLQTF